MHAPFMFPKETHQIDEKALEMSVLCSHLLQKRIKLMHDRERPHQKGDRIRKLWHCLIRRVTWVWVARTREIGSFWLETLPKMGQMT
jgi:hypothetical protein